MILNWSKLILLFMFILPALTWASDRLAWDKVNSAVMYRLYYWESEASQEVWTKNFSGDELAVDLKELNLEYDVEYIFVLTAINTQAIESNRSNEVTYIMTPPNLTETFPENNKPPITVTLPPNSVLQIIVGN